MHGRETWRRRERRGGGAREGRSRHWGGNVIWFKSRAKEGNRYKGKGRKGKRVKGRWYGELDKKGQARKKRGGKFGSEMEMKVEMGDT